MSIELLYSMDPSKQSASYESERERERKMEIKTKNYSTVYCSVRMSSRSIYK